MPWYSILALSVIGAGVVFVLVMTVLWCVHLAKTDRGGDPRGE